MVWTTSFDSVTLMEVGKGKAIEESRTKHTHGLGKA